VLSREIDVVIRRGDDGIDPNIVVVEQIFEEEDVDVSILDEMLRLSTMARTR
jgi:hypothetical protein